MCLWAVIASCNGGFLEKDPDLAETQTYPYAVVIIACLVGLAGWILYAIVGPGWWKVLLVLIAVPVLFWMLARVRDRYTRHISTKLGLSFAPGFPAIPPGSPAHGRTPWGFTGYTLSRRDGPAILNLYEQSYSVRSTRGRAYRAHGLWWQFDDRVFPEFEVRSRTGVSFMALAMAAEEEISFPDDPRFSARFTVHGPADSQIRGLLTPEVRRALLDEVDKGTVAGNGPVLAWDRRGRLWGATAIEKLTLRAGRLRQAFELALRGVR